MNRDSTNSASLNSQRESVADGHSADAMRHFDEAEAVTIVSHFENGTFEKRDVGGVTGPIHDYDVIAADGRTIALEITRHVREDLAAQNSCEENYEWRFSSLRKSWEIKVPTVVNVKQVHESLSTILESLEVLLEDRSDDEYILIGVEQMDGVRSPINQSVAEKRRPASSDYPKPPISPSELQSRLVDLGLGRATLACSDAHREMSGQVKIRTVVGMGGFQSNAGVIGRELSPIVDKKSRQLEYAMADERHLFVWVAEGHPDMHVALVDDVIPLPRLELGASVDVLWLGIHNYPPMVWRYDNHSKVWEYKTRRSEFVHELETKLDSLYDSATQARRQEQRETIQHLDRLSRLLFG